MSKARAKGTAYESAIVAYLRSQDVEAGRQPLAGNIDLGDIHTEKFCIEAKAARKREIPSWVSEAEKEAEASNRIGVVFSKTPSKRIEEGVAIMSVRSFVGLMKEFEALTADKKIVDELLTRASDAVRG